MSKKGTFLHKIAFFMKIKQKMAKKAVFWPSPG